MSAQKNRIQASSAILTRALVPLLTSGRTWKMSLLHAVQDEPHEDEGVVAVVRVQIPHNTLAQLAEVLRLGKLALIHKAGPGPDRFPPAVQPLFCHIPREAFRKESGNRRRKGTEGEDIPVPFPLIHSVTFYSASHSVNESETGLQIRFLYSVLCLSNN